MMHLARKRRTRNSLMHIIGYLHGQVNRSIALFFTFFYLWLIFVVDLQAITALTVVTRAISAEPEVVYVHIAA